MPLREGRELIITPSPSLYLVFSGVNSVGVNQGISCRCSMEADSQRTPAADQVLQTIRGGNKLRGYYQSGIDDHYRTTYALF